MSFSRTPRATWLRYARIHTPGPMFAETPDIPESERSVPSEEELKKAHMSVLDGNAIRTVTADQMRKWLRWDVRGNNDFIERLHGLHYGLGLSGMTESELENERLALRRTRENLDNDIALVERLIERKRSGQPDLRILRY